MLATFTRLAGLGRDAAPELVTHSIVESIATSTAQVVDELSEVSAFDDVVLFGGAARMHLLVQRLSELSGRVVRVGSAEAAAVGNAIVQGVAIGVFGSLGDGRARVA